MPEMALNYINRNGPGSERAGAEREDYMHDLDLIFNNFSEDMKEKARGRLPMNLQFFAEDGGGSGGSEGDEGLLGDDGEEKPTFDDLLAVKENQAEFDRRLQKAVKTAVSNAEEKWKLLADEKASEAEKLAKMNKEEKEKYAAEKRERELVARETEITKRELKAEAKIALADKGLPIGLAETLNYSDSDSCKKSIDAVSKAFQEAVQKAVEDKLKGGKTITKAPAGKSNPKDMSYEEFCNQFDTN